MTKQKIAYRKMETVTAWELAEHLSTLERAAQTLDPHAVVYVEFYVALGDYADRIDLMEEYLSDGSKVYTIHVVGK